MNNKALTAAVVITTYNNPKCLELCLRSFSNQTYNNFDVFIADDGSSDETRTMIAKIKNDFNFRILHIWQPDEGYRKAKVNNTVFSQIDENQYPILICVDHDVIVHHRFVEDHYKIHEKEKFVPLLFMGRRVDLSEALTQKIHVNNVTDFNQGLTLDLILSAIKKETKNVLRSVRLDAADWITHFIKRDRVYDLLGSNYSLTTSVMKQVNGYNEDFKSYWGEDGDLFVRLRNSGIKCIGRIGYAVQWHLYHERLEETPEHIEMYRALLKNKDYKFCKNGIKKS